MTIHMEDHSITYPCRIVEDLLVNVRKFVFPVDFVVLDMKKGVDLPIILGIPFLSTASALVDIHDSKLKLRVEDEEVTFGVKQKANHKQYMDEVLCVNGSNDVVENKEEAEDVNELEEIKRIMEDEILVWESPTPKEDGKLMKP